MTAKFPGSVPATDRGARIALIFALVAERLAIHYERGQWLSDAQGATLAAEWLARSKRVVPSDERRKLSVLSDQMARGIAETVSREAGLFTVHEMREALDPNYHSDLAQALMIECERLLDEAMPNP